MAALNELIQKIENPELRAQIQAAADKLIKQKKFGLVFEDHLPECTPLYDIPVRKGLKVSLRNGKANETYTVLKIEAGKALCLPRNGNEAVEFAVSDLVTTAELGDPIYPCLQMLDEVCNAPGSDLWHTLIEADNYHALQLLEYLYAGQVDCIYIDPPYNSGAKDWKYNNDYVDNNDTYRHSKWLSMMKKRLEIARQLLNPNDSVLIVTIDEKEYLHLGCLLEEMFPDSKMQMVSDVINPRGATRDGQFSRSDEYIFIVQLGANSVSYPKAGSKHYVEWYRLRRTDYDSRRGTVKGGTRQFYPIYVDTKSEKIVHIGEPLSIGQDRNSVPQIEGAVPVFPIKNDGTEMNWGVTPETLKLLIDNHFVRVRRNDDEKYQPYLLHYISYKQLEAIREGKSSIEGYNPDGTAIVVEDDGHIIRPGSAWNIASHNAGTYGSEILANIIGEKRFNFPKSLYSVLDILRYFLREKPNALVVDFFAGSGTTLHAINLLNFEDNGNRRCIMVTNNEVSSSEGKVLREHGFQPGDEEWNALGIARYVTWPRTVCSIRGSNIKDQPIKGNYGVMEEEFTLDEDSIVLSKITGKPISRKVYIKKKTQKEPILSNIKCSDGLKANAVFFKLGFLDKTKVSLGMQFKELLSILWMKAGTIGKCPTIDAGVPDMLILPENKMAILNDENQFGAFAEKLAQHPEIEVVYLVTDYESSFVSMTQALEGKTTYQLYRDYLDNFRINAGRNSR
ncbi:site-specific DNA-methyltransferase [Pseudoflavonifractor hominis]|uniref:Site-specific DNA-methyltransferase n=1 Tax=Pseudoflavonifractor hominis TaxID=2763059 RepID=A0ABR7HST8_9FIRM|nr:DNA methyltransferase [Pseudoflavonifractor hominis]MBC5730584.1 site-specific DNA-methyltransferase [Pseudoflavonifractor hominis]